MTRWQAKLEKKQAVLGRIVDIGAELYAIACAAVYAQTLRAEHPERGDEAVELADLFIRQARRRVEALFGELFSNDDDANYALAQQVLEGRHTWLEEGIADPSGDGPMIAPQPEEVSRARQCAGAPFWEHAEQGGGRQGENRVGNHRGRAGASRARTTERRGKRAGLAGDRGVARVPGAGDGTALLPRAGHDRVPRRRHRLPAAGVLRPGLHGQGPRRDPDRLPGRADPGAADLGDHLRLPAQGGLDVRAARADGRQGRDRGRDAR